MKKVLFLFQSVLLLGSFLIMFYILVGCDQPPKNGDSQLGTEQPSHLGKPANFNACHELVVKVPQGSAKLRLWMAMPQEVPEQKITDLHVESPYSHRIETATDGNKYIYIEAEKPNVAEFKVTTTFKIERKEVLTSIDTKRAKPLSENEKKEMAQYLEANTNVIIDDRIRQVSKEVVGDEKNPLIAARKIYDWELKYADYWVKDPENKKASPVGSTDYCYTSKTGNCTDFHSLWTSVARSSGIPTRMVYGSFFKKELNNVDKDQSYHCWPEFYVSGMGWIPHDVAVADLFDEEIQLTEKSKPLVQLTTASGYHGKDPKMVDFYFGNLDNRRVTWSVGRDLILAPKQDTGPVNAMPKGHVEIDGKAHTDWTRKLTYQEING